MEKFENLIKTLSDLADKYEFEQEDMDLLQAEIDEIYNAVPDMEDEVVEIEVEEPIEE